MSERIELTDEESAEVVRLANAAAGLKLFSHASWVHHVIDAINQVRAPDPVGTIRRYKDGTLGIRVAQTRWAGSGRWWTVNPSVPEMLSDLYEHQFNHEAWPVVYRPEATNG